MKSRCIPMRGPDVLGVLECEKLFFCLFEWSGIRGSTSILCIKTLACTCCRFSCISAHTLSSLPVECRLISLHLRKVTVSCAELLNKSRNIKLDSGSTVYFFLERKINKTWGKEIIIFVSLITRVVGVSNGYLGRVVFSCLGE